MESIYSEIEPYKHNYLKVGDIDKIYWEICGNPEGIPALVVHGGPGSEATSWWRRLFNPKLYKIVLFDQRGCYRSFPSVSDPKTSLQENTTKNLLEDIEKLRLFLEIDNWLLLGGSWGSTRALAYATTYPKNVTGLILFGVTTGRYSELDWTFKGGLAKFFPEEWDKLIQGIAKGNNTSDVVKAYNEMLNGIDLEIRRKATEQWCKWESATPEWLPTNEIQKRFKDLDFAYGFARLVTHYVSHNAWLEDNIILKKASQLNNIPGILINGRFNFQAPIGYAWELMKYWKNAKLVIIKDSGHSPNENLEKEIVKATEQFAKQKFH